MRRAAAVAGLAGLAALASPAPAAAKVAISAASDLTEGSTLTHTLLSLAGRQRSLEAQSQIPGAAGRRAKQLLQTKAETLGKLQSLLSGSATAVARSHASQNASSRSKQHLPQVQETASQRAQSMLEDAVRSLLEQLKAIKKTNDRCAKRARAATTAELSKKQKHEEIGRKRLLAQKQAKSSIDSANTAIDEDLKTLNGPAANPEFNKLTINAQLRQADKARLASAAQRTKDNKGFVAARQETEHYLSTMAELVKILGLESSQGSSGAGGKSTNLAPLVSKFETLIGLKKRSLAKMQSVEETQSKDYE